MKKSFQTFDNKGFHITFPNGIVLSTQFGPGNYGDNYDKPFLYGEHAPRSYEADKVEIAIFRADGTGDWLTKEYSKDLDDDVMGRIDLEEWLKVFDWCRNYVPIEAAQKGEESK